MTDPKPPPPPPPPATVQPPAGAALGVSEVVEPEVPPPPASAAVFRPRAGQLTTGWQIMVAASWSMAFFAFAGVWKASEEVGIATWWLGPRADPQPILVRILPFLIIVAVALCAVYNLRIVSWIAVVGAGALAVIAAADLSYMTGLAIAEFAIAGSVALVSLASFGGRYRLPDPLIDPPDGAPAPLADPVP